MIEDSGMNSSGAAHKAKKRDEAVKPLIIKREKKRKAIEEAEEFARLVTQFTL